ncbi:hypothetical protein D3C76_994250 [compost metagenome]
MIPLHRTALQERQLTILLAHAEHHDLVGRASVAHIQEAPVCRQVQATCRFRRSFLALGQGQALAFDQVALLHIEHHHICTHFQGQVGVPALGVEQQVARPAARRQVHRRGDRRRQRVVCAGTVVAVDEHLVGTQVAGIQVTAVR